MGKSASRIGMLGEDCINRLAECRRVRLPIGKRTRTCDPSVDIVRKNGQNPIERRDRVRVTAETEVSECDLL